MKGELKFGKGGKIMKTYDDFGGDYDEFTDYVMDRIDTDERRKIREDWNRESRRDMLTKDEKRWENYLLKRVNEKSYEKGGMVNEAIENFKRADIDGETMQYIIEKLGMEKQMLRQLVLSNHINETVEVLDELQFEVHNKLR